VKVAWLLTSDPPEAADGATIDPTEPAGLTDAAPLGGVLEDRFGPARGQA
jgi:hypothetical protein